MLIRGQIAAGGSIKSSNYEEGVSGFALNSDGSAEFFDVKIYGKVPAPQLFIGGSVVQGGFYIEQVDVIVVEAVGVTTYYSTDGTVPAPTPANQIPLDNILTVSANWDLVLISYENSTSRSSEPTLSPFRISRPLGVCGFAPNEYKFRIRSYYDTDYMHIQWMEVPDPSTGTWAVLPKKTYYRQSGVVDGFVFESGETLNPAHGWHLLYFHATSPSSSDRTGPIYRRKYTIGDRSPNFESTIHAYIDSSWVLVDKDRRAEMNTKRLKEITSATQIDGNEKLVAIADPAGTGADVLIPLADLLALIRTPPDANFRFKDAGTFQILNVTDNKYHSIWLETEGGKPVLKWAETGEA